MPYVERTVLPDGRIQYWYPERGYRYYTPKKGAKGPKKEGRHGAYFNHHWIDMQHMLPDDERSMPDTLDFLDAELVVSDLFINPSTTLEPVEQQLNAVEVTPDQSL